MTEDYDGRREELLNLVQSASLESVYFRELSAVRESDESGPIGVDVGPRFGLRLGSDDEGHGLGINLRCELEPEGAKVAVEVVAEYTLNEESAGEFELDENLVTHFANEVGVMALLPFVRQAVADLTQRVMGGALLMPVMQRGDLTFNVPPPSTGVRSDPDDTD